MATFGVDVTLISSGEHVLPREDEDAARAVEAGLEAAGVRIVRGGAIGTGLFLASGATVANAGPGGALRVRGDWYPMVPLLCSPWAR